MYLCSLSASWSLQQLNAQIIVALKFGSKQRRPGNEIACWRLLNPKLKPSDHINSSAVKHVEFIIRKKLNLKPPTEGSFTILPYTHASTPVTSKKFEHSYFSNDDMHYTNTHVDN